MQPSSSGQPPPAPRPRPTSFVLQNLLEFIAKITVDDINTAEKCGGGGFGDVYMLTHPAVGKLALKRMRISGNKYEVDAQIRRSAREAETWRRLNHPNILPFFDVIERSGYIYLVSPFVRNGSISDFTRQHPDIDRARLIQEAAAGLAYLHRIGIVHGDIKGANILISDDIRSLLCDFGLAHPEESNTSTDMRGTGTHRWKSPELLSHGHKTFKSDVWAFGMTIYEILSGHIPYHDCRPDTAVIIAVILHKQRPPKEPETSPAGASYATLWEVAGDCWKEEPDQRPDIQEAHDRLILGGFQSLLLSSPPIENRQALSHSAPLPPLESGILQRIIPPLTPEASDPARADLGQRGPITSSFDRLPNEPLLSILNFLNATSIIAFAITCKRHYQVATDDATWLPIVFQVMAPHTSGRSLTPSLLLARGSDLLASITQTDTFVSNPLFQIYSKHIAQYGWMLGWWYLTVAPTDSRRMKRNHLCRIHIDLRINEAGDLKYGIIARNPHFPSVTLDPSLFVNNPRLIPKQSRVGEALEISVPGAPSLSIDGYLGHGSEVMMDISAPIGVIFDGNALEGHEYPNILRIHPSFSPPDPPMKEIPKLSFDDPCQRHDGAPFPSPSLQPLFLDTRATFTPPLPTSPGDCLTWSVPHGTAFASRISAPTSFTSLPTDLLRSGIYIGPFGGHGWEYVLVRIRHLVEEDFVVTWPWEGSLSSAPGSRGLHLGPFSDTFRSLSDEGIRVSREHVRPGARILEVVKITGDKNVPRGQRTMLAFIDDPRVPDLDSVELRDEGQASPGECPWPIFQDHASRPPGELVETLFDPSRGVDIPGCIRLAAPGFSRPHWDNCTLHVESRTRFSAWAYRLNQVSIFTRVSDMKL